jgi:hypothetical protein
MTNMIVNTLLIIEIDMSTRKNHAIQIKVIAQFP